MNAFTGRIAQWLLILTATLLAPTADALDVRMAPDDHVYFLREQQAFGVGNVEIQNVAIVNNSNETVTIEEVIFQVWLGNELVGCQREAGQRFDENWSTLMKFYLDGPGVKAMEDPRYRFRQLLGDGVQLSPTTTLAPQTAIYVSHRFQMIHAAAAVLDGRLKFSWPDRIHIIVHAKTTADQVLTAENEIRIVDYQPRNEYYFPVRGRWYINSSSSVRSHHRYLPTHEFALDLIQIGAGGSSFKGDGTHHADYYAYGANVHSIGDGVVVTVKGDVADTRLRRKGESLEDYRAAVWDPLTEKGYLATGGNLIVIEHPGGEYSSYAHLRHDSIRVKKGDAVKRGQIIAQIGLSGDGYQPHLHFQVTDSPDMSYSRGLPMIFANVTPVLFASTYETRSPRQLQTGEFVDAVDK